MHHLLQSLSRRQSVILLTVMILEGEEALGLLRYLPDEDKHAIQGAGQNLLQEAPLKQLLPQLVTELKRQLKEQNATAVDQLDPEWLGDFLYGESPQAISAILRNFPRPVAERLARALPRDVAQRLPMRQGHIDQDILQIVKQTFDKRCPSMPSTQPTVLGLESLSALKNEDLYTLIRDLGFRELAIAFRGAGRGPLTELCRRLGQEEAENLLATIRRLPPSSPQEIKAAQRTIRAISFGNRSKSEIIEEAGLCLLQGAIQDLPNDVKKPIAYRLPRRVGERLLQYDNQGLSAHDTLTIQHQVLNTIQGIAEEGRIASFWKDLPIDLPPLPEPANEEVA